jgi:hypothetical protein
MLKTAPIASQTGSSKRGKEMAAMTASSTLILPTNARAVFDDGTKSAGFVSPSEKNLLTQFHLELTLINCKIHENCY